MPNKRKRRQNKQREAQFKNYQYKAEKNKESKILRHMQNHPNDKQSLNRDKVDSYAKKI